MKRLRQPTIFFGQKCFFYTNNKPMALIAGIKLHKTPSGEIKAATIDMKKHGELLKPLLEKVGAVVEDDFDKR